MDYSVLSNEELKEKKKKYQLKIIVITLILVAVAFLLADIGFLELVKLKIPLYLYLALACIISSLCATIYLGRKLKPINDELFKRAKAEKNLLKEKTVPKGCKTVVTLIGNNVRIADFYGLRELKNNRSYYMWQADNSLCFFPETLKNNTEGSLKCIPLEDIMCFEEIGEHYHETKITGGGPSLSGAIVGNAIGGTAGAVLLGSRGAPVQSKDVVHDDRAVRLRFSNQLYLNFKFDDLITFKMVIPNKEASKIMQSLDNSSNPVYDPTEEIRKYKKLLDDGIINQADFDLKKSQLMNL